MASVSLLRSFQPAKDDLVRETERAWLSHSVDDGRLYRHVRRRNGSVTTSSVIKSAATGDLAADYDLSWLRSETQPAVGSTKSSIRVADLFAGCGAMSLGVQESCRALNIGFEAVFAAELDSVKASVFASNLMPRDLQLGPIENVLDGELGAATTETEKDLIGRVGAVDVLLGGPPCQGHSDLNNHTRRDDERNGLVTRMARFAELFRPKHVIVENVQGVRHDRNRSASTSAAYLRMLGYEMEELLVPCSSLGVPQSRRRYMLVASLQASNHLSNGFEHFRCSERPVSWALADLLEASGEGVFNTSAKHSAENERRIRYLFEKNLYDLPDTQRPACHRLKAHAYKAVYGRMRWDEPAPTITTGFGSTGQGRFVHPLRPRTLTPHEAARLQTIPDFFRFGDPGRTQLQKMIGNSVPCLAMAMIGLSVLR